MPADKDSEIGAISAIGPFAAPPPTKYERLVARAKEVSAASTIVVHPCDETSLRGPVEAAEAGLIVPILVGPAAKISAVAREHGLRIDGFEIVDVPHSGAAAIKGVELIRESKGELLMSEWDPGVVLTLLISRFRLSVRLSSSLSCAWE